MSVPVAHNGHIRSFFPPKSRAVSSITTSVNEDGSRQKRRRTDSPEPRLEIQAHQTVLSWEEQLRVAAGADLSPSYGDGMTNNLPGVAPGDEPCDDDGKPILSKFMTEYQESSGSTVTHVFVSAAAQLPSHHPKKKRNSPRGKSKHTSVDQSNRTEAISEFIDTTVDENHARKGITGSDGSLLQKEVPTQKMIEVRPDGKLSSPKKLEKRVRSPGSRGRSDSYGDTNQGGSGQMIKLRPDGRLAPLKNKKHPGEGDVVDELPTIAIDAQAMVSSTAKSSKDRTPPKKLMKLRSDGKLASPTTQTTGEIVQNKRRGRPKKQTGKVTLGVVVMKYGSTDESRNSIGKLVQEILSRPATLPTLALQGDTSRRSPEPPKATHPFFLGKPTQNSEADILDPEHGKKVGSIAGTGSEQQSNLAIAKTISPRKPAVKVYPSSQASVGASARNSNLVGGSSALSLREAEHPIWPPQGMVHVCPESDCQSESLLLSEKTPSADLRPSVVEKLKTAEAKISEREEVVHNHIALVDAWRTTETGSTLHSAQHRVLRVPSRTVLRGEELQKVYTKRYNSQPNTGGGSNGFGAEDVDELGGGNHHSQHSHPALGHLFDSLATSQSAFDRFECETYLWSHKYAPKEANDVLQPGREALILRDWLRSLAVNSIDYGTCDKGKTQDTSKALKKLSAGLQKKKRKRAEELDGFVVSSDEEANEMDELLDDPHVASYCLQDADRKRTEVRMHEAANLSTNADEREKATNAIVVSGPHGCGKTAAVYAAAQELGYEVFEINPGSRRSGKDILDRVGDMSRNHLVNHRQTDAPGNTDAPECESLPDSEALKQDIETGRQSTMTAFLQPKKKQKGALKKEKQPKEDVAEVKIVKQKAQKQSVILLEEVDVLFGEDKQFWATIMELIVQSRRPIVMTCTDERLLPLEDLPLFGILRFTRPPEPLATQYLLLLACSEGHLLTRKAVSAQYTATNNDLRATITQLQFFCQMGIGDIKGGLDWMLIPPPGMPDQDLRNKRVISEGTYLDGMDWISRKHDIPQPGQSIDDEIDIALAFLDDWGIDLAEQDHFLPATADVSLSDSQDSNLQKLDTLDLVYDALSAADVLQYSTFRGDLLSPFDTSTPKMPEKERTNYVEGSTLLQADSSEDLSRVSDSIAAALIMSARRSFIDITHTCGAQSLNEQYMIDTLPSALQARRRPKPVTQRTLSTALAPLGKPSKLSTLALKGPFISTLDSPTPTITQDIAPYVRSIVSYDLRLEEHRTQLELAAAGGRNGGKRARTTRASRAALEGGSKKDTRRERWFPASTDFAKVLGTGGSNWQVEALSKTALEGDYVVGADGGLLLSQSSVKSTEVRLGELED
ncbi:MAG: hypothetical protein Q9218_006513 [Villophora microphyllina]